MGASRHDRPSPPTPPAGDLGALRKEHAAAGVGPLYLAEVRASAYSIVPRYNAAVYSEIGNWRHGLEDLVQDIVTDSLLRDQQAQYMLDMAPTIEDFRRLLARQVRRRLARRRTRTVVDNLIDRSRPLLAAAPFVRHQRHQATTFGLEGADTETRAATFPELRAAAEAIRPLPQRGHMGGQRAPIVYSTKVLSEALRRVAEALPVAFTVGELDRILRLALPHFLPSVLDSDGSSAEHTPINRAVVRQCISDLRVRLDDEGRMVLGMKLAGASDGEVGAALGLSRRTATNRKTRVYGALEDVLGPLSHEERLAAIDQLRPEIQVSLRQVRLSTWGAK